MLCLGGVQVRKRAPVHKVLRAARRVSDTGQVPRSTRLSHGAAAGEWRHQSDGDAPTPVHHVGEQHANAVAVAGDPHPHEEQVSPLTVADAAPDRLNQQPLHYPPPSSYLTP
jgi:hypothetical protein